MDNVRRTSDFGEYITVSAGTNGLESKELDDKDQNGTTSMDRNEVGGSDAKEAEILRENDKAMRRWGKVIDMKSYTPGSTIRLMTLVIAIFIIPIQLFCDGLVRTREEDMILSL